MKKFILIIVSAFLFMGFTENDEGGCQGKYQMTMVFHDGEDKMLMFDTQTAKVYEYDWTFNHWKQLTFGSHIIGN